MTPGQRLAGQRGSGAVAMLAIVPAVVAVMVVTLEATAMVAAGAAAAGTADLAALAAAGALAEPPGGRGSPSADAAAARIASANRARMVSCRCDDVPVEVTVAVRVTSPFGLLADRTATGTARATLVPDDS